MPRFGGIFGETSLIDGGNMPVRETDKLKDTTIQNAKPKEKPYKLFDGEGLYIEITPNGSKYWRLKYRFGGKEKRISLGVYYGSTAKNPKHISLKEARRLRYDLRESLHRGEDPAEIKRQEKLTKELGLNNSFELVAREWFKKEKSSWSDGHTVRVERFLDKYLVPSLGKRPIAEITPPELLQTLRKKENEGKHETAHRVKQTAGQIFRYAVATGRAERDPSQDLRGALTKPQEKHFASITNPKEVGKLLRAIDAYEGSKIVEIALKLSPLLFCRPGELRHMEWEEIDWQQSRWEIPAHKMKMKLPHIVPLSSQALYLLKELEPLTNKSKYVFPSARGYSRARSEAAVRTALRAMGYTNNQMTPHGFRAMARTLLDEGLGYRIEWIEHQLAHSVKDANGRAYNRTSYLEQRTEMMQSWANFIDKLKNESITTSQKQRTTLEN